VLLLVKRCPVPGLVVDLGQRLDQFLNPILHEYKNRES
jgi:hypothetical protein